jgi:hypothetical protein
MPGCEEALPEVSLDNLSGFPNSGEIGAGVPFEKEIEIQRKLRKNRRQRIEVWVKESGNLEIRKSRHD